MHRTRFISAALAGSALLASAQVVAAQQSDLSITPFVSVMKMDFHLAKAPRTECAERIDDLLAIDLQRREECVSRRAAISITKRAKCGVLARPAGHARVLELR